MDAKLRDKYNKELDERMSGGDSVHDKPHVLRVHGNYLMFKDGHPEEPELTDIFLDGLECLALSHDFGHSLGGKDHGADGAKILAEELFKGRLKETPLQDMVIYGTANHSRPNNLPPAPRKHILACYLLKVFDHMDAIGYIGIQRAHIYGDHKRKPLFQPQPWLNSASDVQNLIQNPHLFKVGGKGEIEVKKDSQFGICLSQALVTYEICGERVEDYLNGRTKAEIHYRRQVMERHALGLAEQILGPIDTKGNRW